MLQQYHTQLSMPTHPNSLARQNKKKRNMHAFIYLLEGSCMYPLMYLCLEYRYKHPSKAAGTEKNKQTVFVHQ